MCGPIVASRRTSTFKKAKKDRQIAWNFKSVKKKVEENLKSCKKKKKKKKEDEGNETKRSKGTDGDSVARFFLVWQSETATPVARKRYKLSKNDEP